MNDSVESIKTIFARLLENMPIKREFKLRRAMLHWPDIVGADIAAQSEPLRVEYRVLWLSVNSSVWSHHLMMMKRQLINRFNAYCAENIVEDIRFLSAGQKRRAAAKSASGSVSDDEFRPNRMLLSLDASKSIKQAAALTAEPELGRRAAQLYRYELLFQQYKKKQGYQPCKSCGVLCRDGLCTVCSREARNERRQRLRSLINELPWFTYAEINRELPCSSYDYITAKTELLQLYAAELPREEAAAKDSEALLMLTMLFCGVSCERITDELMQKTYKKFRRRF